MDYNRFKYEAAQRAKESRRKATTTGIKEMKYRPKIGIGDFDTKTRQVARSYEGHKVKITIMFRGREMSHPELGSEFSTRSPRTVAGGQGRGGARTRRPQHGHGAGARPAGPGTQTLAQRRRRADASQAAHRRRTRRTRRAAGDRPGAHRRGRTDDATLRRPPQTAAASLRPRPAGRIAAANAARPATPPPDTEEPATCRR